MCETIKACIAGCAKCVLIIINVVALTAAIALIAAGSYVMIEGDAYIPDVGVDTETTAIALIVIGVLIFFIGCFGCFGAISGKHALLNIYLIGLLVIIVIEAAIIIYGFVNKSEVNETITESITGPFNEVNTKGTSADPGDLGTVNGIQKLAKCCGIDGPGFYKGVPWVVGLKVPASCCEDAEEDAEKCDAADAYEDGCLDSTDEMVSAAMELLLYILLAVVILQIVCMILAWCSRGDYQPVDA